MPLSDTASYEGYYNTSPECWSVYTEALGSEFSNAFLFGQVHQLTVDSYAVQHAGGKHPDKSIGIHLTGLYLVLDRGVRSPNVPKLHQRLAAAVKTWPHFPPPADTGPVTVFDVAFSNSVEEHVRAAREWAVLVWKAWSPYHVEVARFVERHLTSD